MRPPIGGRALSLYPTAGVYALFLSFGAVTCLAAGLWPLTSRSVVGMWFALSAVMAAEVVAVVVLREGPWIRRTMFPAAFVMGIVALAGSQTLEGLVLTSLGLVLTCQLATYAYPFRQLLVVLPSAVLMFTVGMVLSPVPFHVTVLLLVATIVVVGGGSLGYTLQWLRWHASTDDLTGALRRDAFHRIAQGALDEAVRSGATVSLLALDLDAFKTVNDTLGHAAGDAVLVKVVEGWRDVIGPKDAIGRVGGDEFAVVLVGADAERAADLAREAQVVSGARWTAGIATAAPRGPGRRGDGVGADVRELLARADADLYRHKA